MKKLLLVAVFVFGFVLYANAQITISPTHVFVDSQTRFGSYTVINSGEEPQEVSLNFVFSYSTIDEKGNFEAGKKDSATAAEFSIAQYVRAFPKNFILQPGERQTVRIRVTAPENLSEKMYWARIVTASNRVSPPVGTETAKGVSARVSITLKQIISLYYKVGDVKTGIMIEGMQTNIDENGTLWVSADVNRSGNSPFLGTIYTMVYNQNQEKVAQSIVSTTVYFDRLIMRPVNVSNLPSGNYIAKMRFETQRRDIPEQALPQMPPVVHSAQFTIE